MQRVAAVILAAGCSRRFGPDNKLLADVEGTALVRRVVEAVTQGDVSEIVVVTGHDRPAVESALHGLPLRFRHNADWERGMGSSIAAGVSTLGANAGGAFIIPGDMALLSANLLKKLYDAFETDDGHAIVVPVTSQREQRNPVLWPRRFFSDLSALNGAEGAKRLLAEFAASCRQVTIADEDQFSDVDTAADLATARARLVEIQR